jgi:glucan phosphoethanolaminetransferase (alkaline phosphatase superfamily)
MHYKLHLFLNKINPAILLYKIPFIEKKANEKGIDLTEVVNDLYGNKEYGYSVGVSGGILIVIVFALQVILTKILIRILNIEVILNNYFLISFGIASYALCYYIVFRKAKYLEYFKEYEHWTKMEMKKNIWISFGFIIGVISMSFVSLLML